MLPCISNELREKIRRRLLETFNFKDYFFLFLTDVDKKVYGQYQKYVPLEMNIERIINRVIGNYYRQVDALLADISLIAKNSQKFNSPESELTIKAFQIFEMLCEHIQLMITQGDSVKSLEDTLTG